MITSASWRAVQGTGVKAPRVSETVDRSKTMLGPSMARVVTVATTAPFGLWPLFLLFAKIGAVLFGSGYFLLAFLRANLVERLGWLTERQLLDAIAVGQVTPGPGLYSLTATFIGWPAGRRGQCRRGHRGASSCQPPCSLPSADRWCPASDAHPWPVRPWRVVLNVLCRGPSWRVVFVQLGHAALVDPLTVCPGAAAALALLRYRVNSAWLVAAGLPSGPRPGPGLGAPPQPAGLAGPAGGRLPAPQRIPSQGAVPPERTSVATGSSVRQRRAGRGRRPGNLKGHALQEVA